ncbi:MAG: metallophosphoesterase [Lentisphaeria bacterium]|nr:metallophosphoesterase [Lentisphaeria bacterium]
MKRLWTLAACSLIACGIFLEKSQGAENQQGKQMELKRTALNIDEETAKRLGMTFETVEIKVKGLKKDYAFLWVADLHVIADDLSEVEEKSMNVVKSRIDKTFRNPYNGKTSLENWQMMPEVFNKSGADAVLFGGDICDFSTLASIQVLKEGMHKLTIPYMYARADHDISPWWLATRKFQEINELEKSIDGNEPVQVLEFDDLMVVSFNNATSNMSEAGLKRFKEAYAKGKPIIINTHVPINSLIDTSLGDRCMRDDVKHRNLTWGKGCFYAPNVYTQEFLDLVCAENSPVVTVLAGHLHFPWHSMLTKTISQHLFVPAFKGNIGVVLVKRAE